LIVNIECLQVFILKTTTAVVITFNAQGAIRQLVCMMMMHDDDNLAIRRHIKENKPKT